MKTEDGYIIQQCLDGDPASFSFLVEKYKKAVYALAYFRVGNFHDAQDITQEVFINAYRKLHTLRRWDSFMGWLQRITVNQCKMMLRARSKRPDREFVEDQKPETLAQSSIDFQYEDILHESIQEALSMLPELYRQVLTLRYFGGMTINEMSTFLAVSPSTIDRRISEAKARLREEILAMMKTASERYELPSAFTFNIIEIVKNIRTIPISPSKPLPLGLSLTIGMIFAILSIGSHINISGSLPNMVESLLSDREYPVTIGDFMPFKSSLSHTNFSLGNNGNDNGIMPASSQGQHLPAMAPTEGGKIPDKPSASLGKGWLDSLAYSPDGKILAVSTGLGTIFYDADNFNEIGVLQQDTASSSVAFSPDGKILAIISYDDNKINLWDFQARKIIGSLQTGNSIAFSPDGRILAASGVWQDNVIRIWDVQKQELIGALRGHTDYIYSIALSSDGKTLASVGDDKTIRLWDIKEQKQIGLFNQKSVMYSIAISPDGKTLASGDGKGELLLWDIQEQRLIGSLEGHKSWVYSLAFSPDGKTLVSGGYNEQTIRIWDVQTQKQVGSLQGGSDWNYVAFNPDGKTVASIDSQAICLWDIQEQKLISTIDGFAGSSSSLAFSSDGKILASGEGWKYIRLWDMQEQKSLGRLDGNCGWVIGLNSLAFSPDGKIMASINNDDNYAIYLFDVQKQERIGILKGHSGYVSSIAFTPDGKTLVSSGNQGDQTVRLWDVDKQKQLAVLNNNSWVHTVAISPDGETIAAAVGSERLVRLWDTSTQKEIGTLSDLAAAAFSVAFSPDGETLASCNQNGIIHIWNYRDKKEIDGFQGPKTTGSPSVVIINYSPDGKWLVSLYNGNMQFWDIQTGKEITTNQEQFHKRAVNFSPNGKWMATANSDGTIKLWEVNFPVQGKAVEPMGKAIDTWGKIKATDLFQNYPNPFNPETWIPYCLSEPEDVKIKIYDLKGKLVRTIDLGNKQPGQYLDRQKAAYWDGRNEQGEQVASNTYFTVMEAGEFKGVRKMVMVR